MKHAVISENGNQPDQMMNEKFSHKFKLETFSRRFQISIHDLNSEKKVENNFLALFEVSIAQKISP